MATRKKRSRSPAEREQGRSAPLTASGKTGSDLPLDVVLTPPHRSPADFAATLGFPGEPPFTRGARATMYRGRLWTMRQYAGFGTAKETNRRFRYLLEHGNEGLSVAFDLPTQMGYDSDAPLARGEVGRVGVAISTIQDMGLLFDGLPLDRVSTSMTINATAPILLALYIAVAEGRGIRREALRGTVQNDILKEYIARSTYIYPPGPSMRLALDVIEFCSREVPRWNAISVSGYHIREAGATAVQEIGFTLANGIAYVDEAVARGLDVDAIAPQISFFFNAHIDLLEEVAKFRAARRLWGTIMRDRFHANEAEAAALIREVDRRGGMRKAIESGWVQLQVADSAYRYQVELERGERTVVGVNAFLEEGERIPIPKTNPKLAAERARTLRQFRGGRDPKAAKRHLGRLEDVARREENVMPALIEAVKTKATLGELSDVLRTVFGTYRPRQEGCSGPPTISGSGSA